jgi:hypothetical protein
MISELASLLRPPPVLPALDDTVPAPVAPAGNLPPSLGAGEAVPHLRTKT